MKISETIEDLKRLMAERGDLELVNADGESLSMEFNDDDDEEVIVVE